MTKALAAHCQKLGSQVTLQLIPGMKEHARPPEFEKKFPEWMRAIFAGAKP